MSVSVQDAELDRAVATLRSGGLVAFPTETVYGLGADAMNPAAVSRIFRVKGRPADHPLIVHLADGSQMSSWAHSVPLAAERLAEAFWPGPLTMVLAKAARVPRETTGGMPSVGLRVPAHPLALELLRRFSGGVAAPSANRFGRVSPTRAEHVRADLGRDVDVVLDGGACSVGLESTIVDLTGASPVLLRPGGVTAEQLEAVLGVALSRHVAPGVRAPGLLASHYAPRARVELVEVVDTAARATALAKSGERVAVLVLAADTELLSALPPDVRVIDLGASESDAAQRLYTALRAADTESCDVVLASPPALSGLGEALADRLGKAAGSRS